VSTYFFLCEKKKVSKKETNRKVPRICFVPTYEKVKKSVCSLFSGIGRKFDQNEDRGTHGKFLKDFQGNFLQKVSLKRVWAADQLIWQLVLLRR
jgi:hypothetical protein